MLRDMDGDVIGCLDTDGDVVGRRDMVSFDFPYWLRDMEGDVARLDTFSFDVP